MPRSQSPPDLRRTTADNNKLPSPRQRDRQRITTRRSTAKRSLRSSPPPALARSRRTSRRSTCHSVAADQPSRPLPQSLAAEVVVPVVAAAMIILKIILEFEYSSILSKPDLTLTVMLEHVVDDVFIGIYHVNISILYYFTTAGRAPIPEPSTPSKCIKLNRKLGFEVESSKATDSVYDYDYNQKQLSNTYKSPTDLIIPISGTRDEGFWFRIKNESDVQSKEIKIPSNTYKAVLEVYVSFHGDDEFWCSNMPDSYIESNNLTTSRGNGAF